MAAKRRLDRWVFIRALLFLTFLALCLYLYNETDYSRHISRERIAGTIDSIRGSVGRLGLLGPCLFAGAGCLAITINIPTVLIIAFAVTLFGGVAGTLVSAASVYLATTLIYFVAQFLGRGFVSWAFGDRLRGIEDRLETEGLMTVVYVRLLFFMLPPVNWLLSLTNIRYRELFFGTALGTAHMILLTAWLSDALVNRLRAGESLNPLKTPELLLPLTIGLVLFASLRILDRRRRRRKGKGAP